MATEQQIQTKRIKQLEDEGYYVLKLIKTNKNGIPDIVAIPPNAKVIFSEVKTPKGKVSPLQVHADIIDNVLYSIDLFSDDDLVQYIGGVCNIGEPIFYVIEYYYEEGFYTSILDFHEIDSDEYLDLINKEKTIESYDRIKK